MRLAPTRLLAAALAALSVCAAAPAGGKADAGPMPDLSKAAWVWNDAAALKGGAGVAAHVWFRKTFDLTEEPTAATVLITADNGYDLFVNGQGIGSDLGYGQEHWKSVEKYDVANLLVKGRNVIAVHAQMLGGSAGLVAAMRADFSQDLPLNIRTDATWKMTAKPPRDWQQIATDDSSWKPAVELCLNGGGPWGLVKFGELAKPKPGARTEGPRAVTPTELFVDPPADFAWPAAVVFVADDCSLYGNGRTLFRAGRSRTWSQMDIPGPSLIGRRLMVLRPARPDANAEVLHDAGTGVLGSPSVTFDGKWILFSLIPAGEKFYHVYRMPAGGGEPQRLTDGPFHDFDPAEMPDGRIVFSSTRLGTFEEYHSAPARGLFTLDLKTGAIRQLAHTAVFDNDPRITADGRVAFVRGDNFGERAKVETQIHVVHPDGTAGVVEFGPDRGPITYDRRSARGDFGALLRNFAFGSPAPLSDGRMACLSQQGLLIAEPGESQPRRVGGLGAQQICDISTMGDAADRVLCTTAGKDAVGVLNVETGQIVRVHLSPNRSIHSATYLGPRTRPPVLSRASVEANDDHYPTGFLVCQSVFHSRHTRLDWPRARAVRIYEGHALTQRSSHDDIVHIGTEAIEWGTVPLAPDGSFHVEVPADRAMALQAVDAEGREILNELTWIYVRPGERRSCVGCHAPRQVAPPHGGPQPQALGWAPARLLGQGRPHRFRANNADNGGALNLQLERFREIASIDLHELDVVKGAGLAAEVARLVAELEGKDAGLKISAARRLAIFRDRAAAVPLATLLFDADRQVRLNAALALAACGDRRAAAGLVEALADADPLVAQAANIALENLTGHLVAFAPGAPRGRRGEDAWKALLEGGDWSRLEQANIARLADKDPLTRRNAVLALAHTGGPVGAAALRDALAKGAFNDDLRTCLEAIRALGHLRDADAVDTLVALLPGNETEVKDKAGRVRRQRWGDVNAYHRAAAVGEALGRIGAAHADRKAKIQEALMAAYERLGLYSTYCGAYGDHSALHACHASPMHYRFAEALDAMGAPAARIVPPVIKSMPTDPDRGLLLESDVVERMIGRVVVRSGRADEVIEACLAVLGDEQAKAKAPAPEMTQAVTSSPDAWAGNPNGEPRAAQVLSAVCLDPRYGPRILAALERYAARPATPIGGRPNNPGKIPWNHWVCFFLARTLGRLKYAPAADMLIDAVGKSAPEASLGRPDAPGVRLLYIHNTMTPCWRAAAADALGRIGDRRAVPTLLSAVQDLRNATDVRSNAAKALARLAAPADLPQLRKLAAECPEVSTRRALLAAVANAAAKAPAPAAAAPGRGSTAAH